MTSLTFPLEVVGVILILCIFPDTLFPFPLKIW